MVRKRWVGVGFREDLTLANHDRNAVDLEVRLEADADFADLFEVNPTACSPQAWATGAPLLMLRALLGLESDGKHLIVDPAVPESIGRLELLDLPGRWGRMDAFGRSRKAA